MRVGLVLDDTLDTPDGVQQYVLRVGSWLSEAGHDVHYLVGHTERTDVPNVHSLGRNIQVAFNGNRMSTPLPASRRKLRAFLREQQFDVLHVQIPYSPFLAGRLLHEAPGSTVVVGTFHILPYSRVVVAANWLLGVLNRRSGRRFDKLLAVSQPARSFAEKIYGYRNMTVVPNPVALNQFADAKEVDSTLSVVFLGRLVARKGAQHLLKAIVYGRENRLFSRTFHVTIGGKGELLDELKSYVGEHNLEDVVTFAGFIDEEHKPGLLASADVAVFPSTGGESFGIVLLEAMAAARGVVLAGNNPGYASVLRPMPDQLFDPRDIPAFAQKLAYWLGDTDKRRTVAAAQHNYVQQFDVAVVGKRLQEVYTQALQDRPKT